MKEINDEGDYGFESDFEFDKVYDDLDKGAVSIELSQINKSFDA